MLKNTLVNKGVIKRVAEALGDLNEEVIYVGGATVSLYINDPAAEDVRPTKDIDLSLSIATVGELERTRELLISKGFIQSPEDKVICRFRLDEILVDVMNTTAIDWAPANPWFAPGFESREHIEIDDHNIFILPLPYFLASKFSAFESRGAKDPRASHDLEDIIYILDYREDILAQLVSAPEEVKSFLKERLASFLSHPLMKEALESNLEYESREVRSERIRGIISAFVDPTRA